jgi:hypothetical protein
MRTRFPWLLSRDGSPRAPAVIDGMPRDHPTASLERVNPLRSRPRINAPTRTNGFLITTPGSSAIVVSAPFRLHRGGAPPLRLRLPDVATVNTGGRKRHGSLSFSVAPRSVVVATVHGRPGPSVASKRRGPGRISPRPVFLRHVLPHCRRKPPGPRPRDRRSRPAGRGERHRAVPVGRHPRRPSAAQQPVEGLRQLSTTNRVTAFPELNPHPDGASGTFALRTATSSPHLLPSKP